MDEMKWPDTATWVNGTTAYEDGSVRVHRRSLIDGHSEVLVACPGEEPPARRLQWMTVPDDAVDMDTATLTEWITDQGNAPLEWSFAGVDEHPDAEHRWQIIDDETGDVMAEFTSTRATAEDIARWMSGEIGDGAYWESFTAKRRS